MPSDRHAVAFGQDISDEADVREHFTARAQRYDRSSNWCTDPVLLDLIFQAAAVGTNSTVLDVACGTGLVAARFKGHTGRVVGIDITPAMFAQAAPYLDEMVTGPAEALPFPDGTFDAAYSRQGIQFMDAPAAAREMVRVVKPGGRVVLVNLCAYGALDREEYFEILRLRNPARRNFFLEDDLRDLLVDAGCREVSVRRYVSVEDVDAWSDNGAIEETRREGIREVYRKATPAFCALHAVQSADGTRFHDHMLFGIAVGVK